MRARAPRLAGHVKHGRQCRFTHGGRRAVLAQHVAIPASSSTRHFSIQPAPSTSEIRSSARESPDNDHIEVVGSSAPLLSVKLSASQRLHTRRGSLIGVHGAGEVISTLRMLSALRRVPLGIPFLYQRITATAPLALLIGARSPATAFTVLDLDGRVDWRVVQRGALLAWTGDNLTVHTGVDTTTMSLARLGTSTLTGRGLVALAGSGQIYQVRVTAGEQYIVHPSNVLAYTITRHAPEPFRFKSSTLNLQIPSLGAWLPNTQFMRNMQATTTYRTLAKALFNLRVWLRRTIFGDRLFLRFYGETTLLLQSRGSRVRDVISQRDAAEFAAVHPDISGVLASTSRPGAGGSALAPAQAKAGERPSTANAAGPRVTYANVTRGGTVEFDKR